MSDREDADRLRGVYRKYDVRRTDGSSEPGGKHDGCVYFVLDLNHDPYAVDALIAYAVACRGEYPQLARDIEGMIRDDQKLMDRVPDSGRRLFRKPEDQAQKDRAVHEWNREQREQLRKRKGGRS